VPEIAVPALVVQGTRDSVVRVAQTRRLLRRFTNGPAYVEVDAEHDLTLAENRAWPAVEAAVVEFAQSVKVSDVPYS
jgi:pimeloyl-ACP methyl ester carboxylesterase